MSKPKLFSKWEVNQAIEDMLHRWRKSLEVDTEVVAAALAAVRSSKALLAQQAKESPNVHNIHAPPTNDEATKVTWKFHGQLPQ